MKDRVMCANKNIYDKLHLYGNRNRAKKSYNQ